MKSHYLRYDAQTYEQNGFIEVVGRVRELAQKPRFWQINITCRTQNPTTKEKTKHHFSFRPKERVMLGELAKTVNDFIHAQDDYLPDCESVMVVAKVLI